MYELKKKLETYLRVNFLGPSPRLIKKRIYRAAVSQRLRNTDLEGRPGRKPDMIKFALRIFNNRWQECIQPTTDLY